jgi:predicted regulator of Ras-like GTPase activity (Roadblock/LC7/MglB family)
MTLSREAQNLNWLVSNFARSVPGVAHAIVVSADGLGPEPTSWPPWPRAWPA